MKSYVSKNHLQQSFQNCALFDDISLGFETNCDINHWMAPLRCGRIQLKWKSPLTGVPQGCNLTDHNVLEAWKYWRGAGLAHDVILESFPPLGIDFHFQACHQSDKDLHLKALKFAAKSQSSA